jgi:hypothetical protein
MTGSDKDVNFGEIGSGAAFQYWNDLVSVSMNLMEQQALVWTGLFQKVATSNADPQSWNQQFWEAWMGSLNALQTVSLFPWQWLARYAGNIPNVVLMVDEASETVGPFAVMTPTSAQGLEVAATDLVHVGGSGLISSDAHLNVWAADNGNRLEVSLVNLKGAVPPMDEPQVSVRQRMSLEGEGAGTEGMSAPLTPGLYVGVAYAEDVSVRRPLALIHVYVYPSAAVSPFKP